MEAERCTFFGPLTLVYIPTVADRRRLLPIRDRNIRVTETFAQRRKKFANALWPTCAKCACEKLTFELSLDNDSRKTVPLDGKQCDIVLVIILLDPASMFTVCHPNLVTLIELLYTGRRGAAIMWLVEILQEKYGRFQT